MAAPLGSVGAGSPQIRAVTIGLQIEKNNTNNNRERNLPDRALSKHLSVYIVQTERCDLKGERTSLWTAQRLGDSDIVLCSNV